MTDAEAEDGTPAQRIAVRPKVRFEVFKRDKFTCQYCGRAAPEVVFNCDHIKPVADGGENDPLNLVTSCRACNGGKGATPLSDSSAIEKQRRSLEELEERRQQLEMMVQWRDELSAIRGDVVEMLTKACSRGNYTPSTSGVASLRKWLRKYTVTELLQAIDESFDVYMSFDSDLEGWRNAFSKIQVFADIAKQEAERPYLKRLLYIQGILRNRTGWGQMLPFLEHLVQSGASVDEIERRAKRTDHITHFTDPYSQWLAQVGKPFSGRPYQ